MALFNIFLTFSFIFPFCSMNREKITCKVYQYFLLIVLLSFLSLSLILDRYRAKMRREILNATDLRLKGDFCTASSGPFLPDGVVSCLSLPPDTQTHSYTFLATLMLRPVTPLHIYFIARLQQRFDRIFYGM